MRAAWARRFQAALADGTPAWAAADSNRTLTRFDTPDSSIVTPYSVLAVAIVFFECVTTMNCVDERKSRALRRSDRRWPRRAAASTSSSTQKGLGRERKMASSRATQVIVFSPPERSEMLRGSLPGGRATDFDRRLQEIDIRFEDDVGLAAAKDPLEEFAEVAADRLDRVAEQPPALVVDPGDELLDRLLAAGDVGQLCLEHLQPFGEGFGFGDCFHVDGRHRGQLPPEFVDALVEFAAVGRNLDRAPSASTAAGSGAAESSVMS